MITLLKIAFRSIFRNTRRSLMSTLTIAIGTLATLLFGSFTLYVTLGLQTGTVQRLGHLEVFHQGYFDFGTGNPAAWGIADYPHVMALISEDPVLKPLIKVISPIQNLAGIAGNFESDRSRTFLGVGFLPSGRDKLKEWDEYGTGAPGLKLSGMTDDDLSRGTIGSGLARVLGLCETLRMDNCPKPMSEEKAVLPGQAALPDNIAALAVAETSPQGKDQNGPQLPRIDLLAATSGGAPNVVSLNIGKVDYQGVKEYDDTYVGMHIALAQQLVYGRGEKKITGIIVQLWRTEDMELARARLDEIFRQNALALESRDFAQRFPFYTQSIGMFRTIFGFIAIIIGVVVLFTVSNAMGMSVVERTDEIGTVRAMGVRRSGIRAQFIIEGALLGILGASLGVILALLVVFGVNQWGITWMPPSSPQPVPLQLYLFRAWDMVIEVWVALVLAAILAALVPANRAARLPVVDALRHV